MRPEGWVCPRCAMPHTPEGHDPCIANLPDVEFACCGHGKVGGYFQTKSGVIVHFRRGLRAKTICRYVDIVRGGDLRRLPSNLRVLIKKGGR
jgi:hypothetical protein